MPRINLFVEDRGHEVFLQALLHRFAKKHGVFIETLFANARGGHGKVMGKLKIYMSYAISSRNGNELISRSLKKQLIGNLLKLAIPIHKYYNIS